MRGAITCVVAMVAALALCLVVAHAAEAHRRPECPADWPDWGFTDRWIGPVWHIDRYGDRWLVFGSLTHYRAYAASDRYRIGYVSCTPHEICIWSIHGPAQNVFRNAE